MCCLPGICILSLTIGYKMCVIRHKENKSGKCALQDFRRPHKVTSTFKKSSFETWFDNCQQKKKKKKKKESKYQEFFIIHSIR